MYSAKRKSFFVAVICLVLCVALLIGSTFAWFSDSVSNTGNKIQAGTLDIALGQYNGNAWNDISASTTPVFNSGGDSGNLWEPGYSQYAVLKVSNEGNLAFKYRLDIVKMSPDMAADICDVIDVYALMSYSAADVEKTAAEIKAMLDGGTLTKIGTLSQLMADGDGAAYGELYPQSEVSEGSRYQSAYAMLVLKMPETAGNEYQGCSAEFDIRLRAAQYAYEEDGFGSNLYDQNAEYEAAETENGYITFASENAFTLSNIKTEIKFIEEDPYVQINQTVGKSWDGSIYYLTPEESEWKVWDGTGIPAAKDSTGTFKLYLRGTGNTAMSGAMPAGNNYSSFKFDDAAANIQCTGNIMTLLDYENADTVSVNKRAFFRLFSNCAALTTAPSLPAATLAESCYAYMFMDCTSLETAPSLPAIMLADNCYDAMFSGCTKLANAPALPAENLKQYCYNSMFMGCTSLETAPSLSATTLAESCYAHMFQGCTKLANAPALPAENLKPSCYELMFGACTSLETAPSLPATTLAESCYDSMFNGCSSLKTAPVLSAATLAESCYRAMFQQCTSLETAPSLPADKLADGCYNHMFYECTKLKTAPVMKATDFTADNCCYNMFNGCSGLAISKTTADDAGKFVTIPETTGYEAVKGMFEGTIRGTGVEATPGKGSYKVPATEPTVPYLTFSSDKVFTLGTFGNLCYTGSTDAKVEWSTDTTTWTTWAANGNKPANITAVPDTADSKYKVYLRGKGISSYCPDIDDDVFTALFITQNIGNGVECTGSIMTLLDYENPDSAEMAEYAFAYLFYMCGKLRIAPSLPATDLTKGCYYSMFAECTSLVSAPVLNAEKLAEDCYASMFFGCTSLVSVQTELPAKKLEENCYASMFKDCKALTTPPKLGATSLAKSCCDSMFNGCTSLTSAPNLPDATLCSRCYRSMFINCTSLKVSDSQGTKIFTCPEDTCYATVCMFDNTGGTFAATPETGHTYYWYE